MTNSTNREGNGSWQLFVTVGVIIGLMRWGSSVCGGGAEEGGGGERWVYKDAN